MAYKEGSVLEFIGMYNMYETGLFTVGRHYVVNKNSCIEYDKCKIQPHLLLEPDDNNRVYDFKIIKEN